jgi:hypothetical protein
MIVGAFLFGLIIANMTSVLCTVDVLHMRFRQEMDVLQEYLEKRAVPPALRQRVKLYFDYLYDRQFGMLEGRLLNSREQKLPPKLIDDMCMLHLTQLSMGK